MENKHRILKSIATALVFVLAVVLVALLAIIGIGRAMLKPKTKRRGKGAWEKYHKKCDKSNKNKGI